jgi:hypothetical protein
MLRQVLEHRENNGTANSIENRNSDANAEFDSFREDIIFLVSPNFILQIRVDTVIFFFLFREEIFC